MSVEDLKKYSQMCVQDDALKVKAKDIGLENIDGQIEQAKTLGLNFTKEDLEVLAKEVGAGEAELSDDDLESVAGGFVTALAAAVVGAAVGVGTAATSVTSTTAGGGW